MPLMRYAVWAMNVSQVKNFWIKQSDKDWRVTKGLFNLGHYAHALFFCHLTLEKLIKAVVVKETQKQAPYSHDLLILLKKTRVALNNERKVQLNEITSFNIRARYDDIKYQFYKRATKDYTKQYMTIANKLRLWIKKNYL